MKDLGKFLMIKASSKYLCEGVCGCLRIEVTIYRDQAERVRHRFCVLWDDQERAARRFVERGMGKNAVATWTF
jgi:hypothetical protein